MKDFERSDPKNNIAMNKKHYQKPAMQVVMLQHQQTLLAGSGEPSMINSINGWGNGGEDNEELTI